MNLITIFFLTSRLFAFTICLIDYPERVANLTVEMTSIDTISISWRFQMNGSSPRSGVDIEISNGGISVYNVTQEASQVASALMSLSPLRTYSILVYVVSAVGRSRSSSVNASTLSLSKKIMYIY